MEDLSAAIAADGASDYTLAYELYCKARILLQRKAQRFQVDFSQEIRVISKRIAQIQQQMNLRNVAKPKGSAKIERSVSRKGRPCVGLDNQLSELNEFCLPARFPKMFSNKRRQAHSMLLCGLSGTGKTYSVQTTMARLREGNVVTSHIDLKLLRRQPVEALSQRLCALETIVTHRGVGVFLFVDNLHCLQGSLPVEDMLYRFLKTNIGGEHNGCIVVGATTNPKVISTRMKSFFERRVHYALPDSSARRRTCEGFLSWASIALTPKWNELLSDLERETRLWNYCEIVLVFKLGMLRRSSVQPRFATLETSTAYPKLRVEDVEYVLRNDKQVKETKTKVSTQREKEVDEFQSINAR